MINSKRENLLDTAERLFYSAGFHATGIDRVITQAGVARMTLYNHFPSKEALVEAVLARRYERYLQDLRAAVDNAAPGEAVTALAQRHCRWLETTPGRGCIVLKAIAEYEQDHPAIAEQGRRLKRELLAVIGDALERDRSRGDPRLAERLLMVLEGANALVPVLGAAAATEHLQGIIPAVLATAQGAES
ncbi:MULTISPECIES: TetR/AcrR family transcriptional regulator [unclassified Halorhodospira]|uniref:TetR/AcrR family transcriptional regulator n=1 Tax=unclassified Halorhodospira TaxID=2626748 RepID=UPI001EE7CA1A|nr:MULTISPECIES: TetR/AcrR family transcriptional regulator [unclassified Halorhodospira]MCG5537733.1 TetR/AcrR family transcriptional regulator [Halorhodospira sp. 9622]MCG5539918.1 TetR/AcrR family transcriptional regulator [Halorhodospira sp. M39old]MCG5545246.1 TetR/AcrR family transcriptional regulator [Halorhodospira sp. M38]